MAEQIAHLMARKNKRKKEGSLQGISPNDLKTSHYVPPLEASTSSNSAMG
jgi:hypothetical protein